VISAHHIGLKSTAQDGLTVDGEWTMVMFKDGKNSRNQGESASTLPIVQRPEFLWTNRDDRWIQRVGLVQIPRLEIV
jgi:hypothetical protein